MTTQTSGFKAFVDKTNQTAKNIMHPAQPHVEQNRVEPEYNQTQTKPNNDQQDKEKTTPLNPDAPQPK